MKFSIKKYIMIICTAFLLLFGLLTLFMSGSVIFDLFGIRAKEGNYVLSVVWANFIASFIYLTAAAGFAMNKRWVTPLLTSAVVLLILAFMHLGIHIYNGGLYENKTIFAMAFRTLVTAILSLLSYRYVYQNQS